jgi:WD40 repeat protein
VALEGQLMRLFPETVRGTWLVALVVWVVADAVLWALLPGQPRHILPTGDGHAVTFLADNRTLVTAVYPTAVSERPPFQLWDTATGRLLATHRAGGPDTRLEAVCSLTGRAVLCRPRPALARRDADIERTLSVLDLHTGREEPLPIVLAPGERLEAVFSPDGRHLAVSVHADDHSRTDWWDLTTGRLVRTLPDGLRRGRFSPDGRWFLGQLWSGAGGWPEVSVQLWEVPSGRPGPRLPVILKAGGECEFSAGGHRLLVRNFGETQVWDWAEGRMVLDPPQSFGGSFTPDGESVVVLTRCDDGGYGVTCWDLATDQRRWVSRPYRDNKMPTEVVPAPAGGPIRVTGFWADGPEFYEPTRVEAWLVKLGLVRPKSESASLVHLLDPATGRELHQYVAPGAVWSPDGRTVAGGTGAVEVWDVPPRKPLTWWLALAGAAAVPIAGLAHWRGRRLRAGTLRPGGGVSLFGSDAGRAV